VLLGVGGPGHEAPDLTDTIIFVSTKLSTGETTVISIPRDMWVSSMRAKINTSYHYGEQKQVGGGIILTKSSITEVLGQPVHYAAILNFSTFVGVIDRLGGIDVNVENSFIDNKYPIAGRENDDCGGDDPEYLCRFETISFNAGLQHMDGTTALKYVRSRHSESQTEGTDFARSKRQTQVLKGVKSKFIEMSKDPKKYKLLLSVFEVVKSEIITDFPSNKIVASLLLANKIRSHELKTYSLSEPIIYHPPLSPLQDNQWVLLPKNNDPQVVYDHIRGLLN
jgi:LCP family protein required for cell wall assembly